MKQTQAFISTYTADVSGVCSALFELGGMTIMHDPSGCNSTYNTHDEPRWYDYDSLVFISGLSEIEAIMGDDEKLINDAVEGVDQLKPEFVAVAGTPIPMMTGCDIPAIAAQIEEKTGKPCFGFSTNGMHSYIEGASAALSAYAKRMTIESMEKTAYPSMNIIGATPLDFSVNGSVESMKKLIESWGWKVIGTWAMGSSVRNIKRAGGAWVNLVVSSVGLKTAEVLYEKFGTPYVVGTPMGTQFNRKIRAALKNAAYTGNGSVVFEDYVPPESADILIIGESIMSRSLADAIWLEYGKECRVLCPVETAEGILSYNDIHEEEEDGIRKQLHEGMTVIADPLYKPIVPEGCTLIELPHEACSGRIFRKRIPNLVENIEGKIF